MGRRPELTSCIAAAVLAVILGAPAQAEARWELLNHAARDAVKAGNHQKLRDTLIELSPLMPGNVRIVYNLAASNAMLHEPAKALLELGRLCRMGVIFDLKADTDFASIASAPEFSQAIDCMAKNGETVTRAKLSVTLPGEDLLPEDLAYDAKTQRFLVSSIRKMQILDTSGNVLATSEWPILSLAIDDRRRTIWATTGWLPQCDSCKPGDKDKTALLAFNLDTGQRLARVESPVPGLLGDMTINSRGDVYVSEGAHGAILVLKRGALMLERIDPEGEFASPQQPALSADGKILYVADYLRGIAAIDLATNKVTWPQPGNDVALNGIDGLQRVGASFIAVQNGTNPQRIVRITQDLKTQQVLEANWAGLGEPTHGIAVGREYYFLAHTGWDSYEDSGRKRAGSAPVISSIWKLPLD